MFFWPLEVFRKHVTFSVMRPLKERWPWHSFRPLFGRRYEHIVLWMWLKRVRGYRQIRHDQIMVFLALQIFGFFAILTWSSVFAPLNLTKVTWNKSTIFGEDKCGSQNWIFFFAFFVHRNNEKHCSSHFVVWWQKTTKPFFGGEKNNRNILQEKTATANLPPAQLWLYSAHEETKGGADLEPALMVQKSLAVAPPWYLSTKQFVADGTHILYSSS